MPIFNTVYGGTGGQPTTRPTITGFTYDNKNWNYSQSDYGDANCLTFKPDGTKLYMVGEVKNTVFQFSLGTAWDITTASYDNKSKATGLNVSSSAIFSDDGLTMYIGGNRNQGYLYKYTLSTARDVSTASYDNISSSVAFNHTASYKFSTDGNYVFRCERQDPPNAVHRYTLTTPRDITSITTTGSQVLTLGTKVVLSECVLNPQGTQLFCLLRNNKQIAIYDLSTARDLTTATLSSTYSISTPNSTNITALTIDNNGSKMYLGGYNIGGIYQYTTTTS